MTQTRRLAAILAADTAKVRFRREASTATLIGKARCPPNSAVRRCRGEGPLWGQSRLFEHNVSCPWIPESGADTAATPRPLFYRCRALYLSAAKRRNSRFIALIWARYFATS
jgi:hypothetical protein